MFVVLRELRAERETSRLPIGKLAAHAQTNKRGRLQIQPAPTIADKRDPVTGSAQIIAVRHPLRRSDDPRRRPPVEPELGRADVAPTPRAPFESG